MSRAPAWPSMKTTPVRSGARCRIPIASKTVRLGFWACPWRPCGSCQRISAALSVSRSPGRFAVLCALLARKTGRPVKIWFTREEESLDSHNRSALTHYVKAGAKKDGSLTAHQGSNFSRQRLLALRRSGTKYRLCDLHAAHRSLSPLSQREVGSFRRADEPPEHRALQRPRRRREPFSHRVRDG